MGKSKIEVERLDNGGLLLRRAKGKITFTEAYEKLQEYGECGIRLIFMRVLYDGSTDELYDDGEEWEIYSAEDWADKIATQKSYDTGFEDGRTFAKESAQAGIRNILADVRNPDSRDVLKARLEQLCSYM